MPSGGGPKTVELISVSARSCSHCRTCASGRCVPQCLIASSAADSSGLYICRCTRSSTIPCFTFEVFPNSPPAAVPRLDVHPCLGNLPFAQCFGTTQPRARRSNLHHMPSFSTFDFLNKVEIVIELLPGAASMSRPLSAYRNVYLGLLGPFEGIIKHV